MKILPCSTRFVSRKLSQSDRPELTNASIIVSGGRGLQSKEQFKIVEDLADKLGAAVGAGAGALSGKFTDVGINDTFMRDLGAKLTPGTAAVFILARKISADKVAERLATLNSGGHILQTSLSADDEAKLAAAFPPKQA
jgi:hypothetical protein